jgi:hypothetical protein
MLLQVDRGGVALPPPHPTTAPPEQTNKPTQNTHKKQRAHSPLPKPFQAL